MRPLEPIVEAIVARRRELGLTRRAAARDSGVSHSAWAYVEAGRSAPTAPTLRLMAAAVGCDVVLAPRVPGESTPERAE